MIHQPIDVQIHEWEILVNVLYNRIDNRDWLHFLLISVSRIETNISAAIRCNSTIFKK